jgi:amidase
MTQQAETWRALVAQKRNELDKQIPSEWRLDDKLKASVLQGHKLIEADVPRRSGLLSDIELDITENYSAVQLLQRLACGEVSSLAVTTGFCKRAAIAQQLVSFLPCQFGVLMMSVY